MHETSVLETVLRRDRMVISMGLVTVIGLSWLYILPGAGMNMPAFDMTTLSLPGSSRPMRLSAEGEATWRHEATASTSAKPRQRGSVNSSIPCHLTPGVTRAPVKHGPRVMWWHTWPGLRSSILT